MPMEQSKHSQEIIDLGKKLVKEFSKHDQRDTTLSWMAHYLSELIISVENEHDGEKRTVLQAKACEVILGIWKNRDDFPRGTRPLTGLSSAVEVINSLRKNDPDYWARSRSYEDHSEWGNFAETMRNSSQNVFDLTLLASVGQEMLLKEKEWSEFPNLLSAEEKEILDFIDQVLQRDKNPIRIVYTTAGSKKKGRKPEKIELVFKRIEKLLNLQLQKYEQLKTAVLGEKNEPDLEEDDDDEFNDFLDD